MANIAKCRKEITDGTFRVCLDSRLIKPGEYFVAVKGENFDGHKFIPDVLERGAVGILEEPDLYSLAKFKLDYIKPVIIGITGSTGKTSTTSFVCQLLASEMSVCNGHQNTKIGLSVDLINEMNLGCKAFVAEMGTDGFGQIRDIVSLFKPHISVITTINQTHIEKLGSIENVSKAKAEIFENAGRNDIAVLNYDNPYTRKLGKDFVGEVLWFGKSRNADFNFFTVSLENICVLGMHNRINLLAAVAVAKEMGLTEEEIKKALSHLVLPKGRLNVIPGINGCILIDDTYNSSPVSAKAALEVLRDYGGKRKIAVLGDMLELGRLEKSYHKKIGEYAYKCGVNVLVCSGGLNSFTCNSASLLGVKTYCICSSQDFGKELIGQIGFKEGDVVLIKGSQGARMERITKMLMADPSSAQDLLVRQDQRWISPVV